MENLSVADFFCGAGGWSEGFRQKGFKVDFALDHWKPAVDTHHLNHPDAKTVRMDIRRLDTPERIDEVVPDTDVIVGSPPCVAFSRSNRSGKADKTLAMELILSYLRIVAWKKSKGKLKHWIMENVPTSERHIKEKYTWKELGLPGRGPDLKVTTRKVLNAADFGVPQNRLRFFCGDFPLPEAGQEPPTTVAQVMAALGQPLEKPTGRIKDPLYGFTKGHTIVTDHHYDTRVEGFEWRKARRLKEDHGFMGRMAFPEDLERPSRTVMATQSASTREALILPGRPGTAEYRLPTIREIACFMSFPITYQFEAGNQISKYRLVGNAVCPMLSASIAEAILHESDLPIANAVGFPNRKARVDLRGTTRTARPPRPRAPDARFNIHIPKLKILSFRVELTNKDSDFKHGKVRWTSVLHYATGPGAKSCSISQAAVTRSLSRFPQFERFKADVERRLTPGLRASMLQQGYCTHGKRGPEPEAYLQLMREIIDRHFPEEKYKKTAVSDSGVFAKMKRPTTPVRILAGLYACNHFVDSIEKDVPQTVSVRA